MVLETIGFAIGAVLGIATFAIMLFAVCAGLFYGLPLLLGAMSSNATE